jgi:hypothetical protein
MWLCTKLGFYSISAKTEKEVHIRARVKKDLENLRRKAIARIPTASAWEIHTSPSPADYRFRIVIHERDVGKIMLLLGDTLDYSNFKGIIAGTSDQRDKLSIYSAFHHDMEHHQNSPR